MISAWPDLDALRTKLVTVVYRYRARGLPTIQASFLLTARRPATRSPSWSGGFPDRDLARPAPRDVLDIPLEATADRKAAVRGADVVTYATTSSARQIAPARIRGAERRGRHSRRRRWQLAPRRP